MLKWLAMLTVFFALLPVHGHQKAAESDAGKNETASGKDEFSSTHPYGICIAITVIDQETTQGNSKTSEDHAADYLHKLFSANNFPNVLLAAIGIVGIFLARRTVSATRDAAIAALKQANHLVATERAWIIVRVNNFKEPTPEAGLVWIDVPVGNSGETPARIKRIVATSKIVPMPEDVYFHPGKLPQIPDYSDSERLIEIEDRDILIVPGETLDRLQVFIRPSELVSIKARESSLYVYGSIEYADTISGGMHETRFCYLYWVPDTGSNESVGFTFSRVIPSAYTRAT